MSESENKVFFSKINDPKTCSPLEEMSAQDVADLINKLQNENKNLKKIIAKELSENDELGCEFVYVAILKDEIELLKRKLELALCYLKVGANYKDKDDCTGFCGDICYSALTAIEMTNE